jgi:hypothetical protein
MKYIDRERQLADIFIKSLDARRFAFFRGNLVFVIPMTWFEGELVFYLISFVYFCFSFTFSSCSHKLTMFHLLY